MNVFSILAAYIYNVNNMMWRKKDTLNEKQEKRRRKGEEDCLIPVYKEQSRRLGLFSLPLAKKNFS